MNRLACLLTVLLTVGPMADALAADAAGSLDDEVALLYSPQLQFSPDGTPLVTVGIMEGQAKVLLSAAHGAEISFPAVTDGELEQKEIHTRGGEVWSLDVAEAVPAQVAYWCGVESIPFGRKEMLDQAISLWKERGQPVQVFEVGSVFGIQGHVVDNRTYILGIQSFETEQQANRAAEEVFQQYGTRTFVHPHLTRRPAGRIRLRKPDGSVAGQAVDLVRVNPLGESTVTLFRVEYGQGYGWHGFENRQFAGTILVTLDRTGSLVVVNRLPVDRLLMGLVPAEIYPNAPMEALKAQAVVARGEVMAKIGARHFLDPYRLCAQTHCQVFAGVRVENSRTSRAVEATRGEFLFLGPDLVDSVYSASCGGHTEDNDAVWAQPPGAALRGRPDMDPLAATAWPGVAEHLGPWLANSPPAFCNLSTFNRKGVFRWSKTIASSEMDALVAKVKPIGHVVSIQVLSRGVSGRVKVVRVVGSEGDLVVQRELPVRQLFGNLKSGMFEVTIETDENQMPKAFHFVGGGWGHGVGMCQIGAIGMAEHGFDYRQVLAHYYSGAQVFRLYGQPVVEKAPLPEAPASTGESGTPLIPDVP